MVKYLTRGMYPSHTIKIQNWSIGVSIKWTSGGQIMEVFKRTALAFSMLALVLPLLTGCQDENSGLITVIFAGTEGATTGQSRMMTESAEILNNSGRFNARVFVSGALGDTDNLVTQARLGVHYVIPSDPGRLASQFNIPDLNILMAPYVLMDPQVLARLPATDIYQEWQAKLELQGVSLVANMFNGFRNFYTTTPVRQLKDLRGLRIRGFGNDIGQALATSLGFTQITMSATEIYPSIQMQALDGAEIQLSTADSYRFFEVAPYLALTRHFMLQSSFVVGTPFLNSMSDEDREFFLQVMYDMAVKWTGIIASEEADYIKNFSNNGGQVFEVDIAEFERAVAPLNENNTLNFTPGLQERLIRELGL